MMPPPAPPSSWAEVCAAKRRLRQASRESGDFIEWRELHDRARSGTDTIEAWNRLFRKVAEHGVWYGLYAMRGDDDDEEQVDPAYGCPDPRRHCGRVVTTSGSAPICELTGIEMVPAASTKP